MTVIRIDNVGIVREDLDAAIEFFTQLRLSLEGRMPIEGGWAGGVTGVRGPRVEIDEVVDYEGIYRLCYISRYASSSMLITTQAWVHQGS